eukprot:898478_1
MSRNRIPVGQRGKPLSLSLYLHVTFIALQYLFANRDISCVSIISEYQLTYMHFIEAIIELESYDRISMQRPSGLFLVVLLGLMTRVLGVSSRNLDDLEFQKSVNRIQSVKNNMKSLSGVSNPRLESWSGQNHCQFYFFIEGAQEVPAVTTMAMGSGRAGLTQDETALNYRFNFDCLSTTFDSAHFHRAAAGTIGPVIFPLRPAVGKSGLAGREVGQWAMIEPDNVEALKNGEIYINIHSMMNPSGEIRGQLIPQNCN